MKLIIIVIVFSILVILSITYLKKIENFGGNKRPATEEDILKGLNYSLYKKCINNGYTGNLTSDTSFDCEHTKTTCMRDSKEDDPFNFYIWEDEKCQLGNLNFKKFCNKEKLDYTEKGECKTNKKYCDSKKEDWDGKDCKINGAQWTSEAIFGKTITRGVKDIFV
jgi:hypothetical protein